MLALIDEPEFLLLGGHCQHPSMGLATFPSHLVAVNSARTASLQTSAELPFRMTDAVGPLLVGLVPLATAIILWTLTRLGRRLLFIFVVARCLIGLSYRMRGFPDFGKSA